MKKLIFIIVVILWFNASGQSDLPDLLEYVAEKNDETEENDRFVRETAEQLVIVSENPVNINNTTEDELSQVPFLTTANISALLKYRQDFGKIFTIYELKAVEGFDSTLIRKIEPFIIFGDEPEQHPLKPGMLIREGRSSLFLRYQRILQEQAGYGSESYPENKRFEGDAARYYFRYSYNYYSRLSFGLTGEKDPGEGFLGKNQQYGMDFYSGYFCLSNSGILKKLVIGNFNAGFGQGLTLGSGSGTGMARGIAGMINATGIRPSLSTEENDYLRGIAATIGKKHFLASLFYSGHKRDANVIASDSLDSAEAAISSLQGTGYHRLPSEVNDKNAVTERIIGGNFTFKNNYLRAGITSFYSSWNRTLLKEDDLYKRYSFSGNENLNTGIDFKLAFRNIYFFGEAGMSLNGGTAWIAGFQSEPAATVSIAASFRNYQPQYQDLRSNATGRYSTNSNEQGILVSASLQLPENFILSGYLDVYRSPYLRYGINNPTSGEEFLLRLDYSGVRNIPMYLSFRGSTNEINIAGDHLKKRETSNKYSLRYQNEWQVSPVILLRSRFEATGNQTGNNDYHFGYLISQTAAVNTLKGIRINLLYALFDTWSYNEKIYLYENDVLYGYSVPSLSGKGIRVSAMITFRITRFADLWLRYASTWYSDRLIIGSGPTEITGNTLSELKIQVRLRF